MTKLCKYCLEEGFEIELEDDLYIIEDHYAECHFDRREQT